MQTHASLVVKSLPLAPQKEDTSFKLADAAAAGIVMACENKESAACLFTCFKRFKTLLSYTDIPSLHNFAKALRSIAENKDMSDEQRRSAIGSLKTEIDPTPKKVISLPLPGGFSDLPKDSTKRRFISKFFKRHALREKSSEELFKYMLKYYNKSLVEATAVVEPKKIAETLLGFVFAHYVIVQQHVLPEKDGIILLGSSDDGSRSRYDNAVAKAIGLDVSFVTTYLTIFVHEPREPRPGYLRNVTVPVGQTNQHTGLSTMSGSNANFS